MNGIQHHHAGLDRDSVFHHPPHSRVAAKDVDDHFARPVGAEPGRTRCTRRGRSGDGLRRGGAGRSARVAHPTFSFAGSKNSLISSVMLGRGVVATTIWSPERRTHTLTLPISSLADG